MAHLRSHRDGRHRAYARRRRSPSYRRRGQTEIVIKRGDPVVVVAGDGGFSVTRDGIATTDAAAGARVLIRVQDGKAPIQAIAVEPGKAMIPGAE